MFSLIKAINRFISKRIYVLLFDLFNAVILNYEPQWATTTHSDLQLRHKMNKTHKNLHSLANALSPLNPLAAGILVETVLIWCFKCKAHAVTFWLLALIQCSGIILFVKDAFGSVFVRVVLQTWNKEWKSKYKFAAKSFLRVYFFLSFTWKFR